jgi:hypothetical protein
VDINPAYIDDIGGISSKKEIACKFRIVPDTVSTT